MSDLITVGLATLLALELRDNFETSLDQLVAFLPYLGSTIIVAGVALVVTGLNRGVRGLSVLHDYLLVVGTAILIVSIAMVIGFLTNRLQNVSRSLPVLQFGLVIFALVGVRVCARLYRLRRDKADARSEAVPEFSTFSETVLLVGINRLTNLYIRSVEDLGQGHVRIGGILASQINYVGRSVGPHKVLGCPLEAAEIVKRLSVHGVFVSRIVVMEAPGALTQAERDGLLAASQKFEVDLEYLSQTLGLARKPVRLATARQAPPIVPELVQLNERLWRYARRPYWSVKRALDGLLSLMALVALAPVFIVVAAAVAMDVGTPVIFWQQRPGVRGRPFRVYKFRTMGASHDARGRKLSDAERISRIGACLRATRFDELPQLFNVLVGDMSFVGPRPLLPADQYPGLEARLAIAPGITGWAQVNGGREISADDKAALDIWYLKNASILVDVRICLATLRVLVGRERTNPAAIEDAWRQLGRPPGPDTRAQPTGTVELPLGAFSAVRSPAQRLPAEANLQALA